MIDIPTILTLYNAILADLQSEFNVTIPSFGKSWLRTYAAVQAAKLKIQYLRLGFIQKNIFVDTADPESMGGTLERFGRVKLGRDPYAATSGQYQIQLYGDPGAFVKAGTTFKSNDDSLSPGKLFVLDTDFTLDGLDVVVVRALEAGVGSKLNLNDQLTVTGPIANLDQGSNVLSVVSEPVAAESTEDYRRKSLDAYRLEPEGGAGADFRLWANEVQGVEQSYPYAKFGYPGEVDLYIEATPEDSVDGHGTPSSQLLDDVRVSVEVPTTARPGRKPLGVYVVHYLPVVVREVSIQIDSYVGIDTAKQALIFAALESELNKIRPFVGSIDVLSAKNDIFDVNRIISIVLAAVPGSSFGTVTLLVDSVSYPSFTFLNGDIGYLNSVTYV